MIRKYLIPCVPSTQLYFILPYAVTPHQLQWEQIPSHRLSMLAASNMLIFRTSAMLSLHLGAVVGLKLEVYGKSDVAGCPCVCYSSRAD
jgi:hypothetical protein